MKSWIVTSSKLLVLGTLSTATAAGQDAAPLSATKAPKPVVITTDTYVRPMKYAKHRYGSDLVVNTSGLPSATQVSGSIRPLGVHFVGQHDRTYIVFGERRCHPAIVFYDHRTKHWSKPRRIGKTGAVDDSHGLPSIAIDSKGYLHVVFGSHGGKQYVIRSSAPEDITQNSPTPNNHPRTIVNGLPELQIIWCSGDRGVKGKVYAWGETGTLAEQAHPVIQGQATR